MTTGLRWMSLDLCRIRPLGDSGGKGRWRWTVYPHPDPAVLRIGQIAGDRETAERTACVAITTKDGSIGTLRRARAH